MWLKLRMVLIQLLAGKQGVLLNVTVTGNDARITPREPGAKLNVLHSSVGVAATDTIGRPYLELRDTQVFVVGY